ncbi:hypothetical protein VE01_02900 [Pseudogymnoascus verrucosus]|uniref:Uncharacterized protein n=1 Tax=Pseudogymnoascus verrucosus TaxID=342668 RepID=A0A1B8GUD4_9PEZI|nr:uncharacterized protein VE01_02900 [Pseudogymnoascus verrucosus]OBT99452.1 hypothetical protein VE01_02900 [Pseudogymnoascus verrucosus]
MPSHHLIRRDSWPPTILRLGHDGISDISDTDANPFAYFLEPAIPADDDNDDYLDLSAGIESDDAKMPQVREVSPSSLQRLPILSDEELEAEQAERDMHDWLSVPHRVKERVNSSGKGSKVGRTGAARGRGLVRSGLVPGPVRRSRSAGPRGRAWREPSPEIGVIEEEGEDVEMEMGMGIGGEPGPSGAGKKMEERGWGKIKKRVHWAMPVEK